jgi:hypothetical protein
MNKQIIISKIEKILNECDKHLIRVNKAYDNTVAILPLDARTYQGLNDDEVEHIDQYLFRFAKLQDVMGTKLFKYILMFLDENVEGMPFVDVLNRMEKLSLLNDSKVWRELRDIRNELSHQYDDDPEEMAIILNNIFAKKEVIEAIYLHIKTYYENKT